MMQKLLINKYAGILNPWAVVICSKKIQCIKFLLIIMVIYIALLIKVHIVNMFLVIGNVGIIINMKKNFLDATEGANLLLIVLLSIIIWFADFFSRNSHFHTLFSVKFKIIFIGLLFVFWLIRLIILKIINFYANQKIVGALLQNSDSKKISSFLSSQ